MFRCEKCKRVSEPKEKCYRVVRKRRPKIYTNGEKISFGWEIEKEAVLCKKCAKNEEKQNEKN